MRMLMLMLVLMLVIMLFLIIILIIIFILIVILIRQNEQCSVLLCWDGGCEARHCEPSSGLLLPALPER